MEAAIITKTLKNVNAQPNEYSLGFKRLMALPSRVRLSFGVAANLQTNWNGKKALENQKSFLEGLTEQEFINWMRLA